MEGDSESSSSSHVTQPGKRYYQQGITGRSLRNAKAKTLATHSQPHRVHAQRKFAQGQNAGSFSNITTESPASLPSQAGESSSGSSKSSKSTPPAMLSSRLGERPKTEDFLTFLCLRGTKLLPPELEFFNIATADNVDEGGDSSGDELPTNGQQEQQTRGQASAGQQEMSSDEANGSSSRAKRLRIKHSVEAMKQKYTEQRLARKVVTPGSSLVKETIHKRKKVGQGPAKASSSSSGNGLGPATERVRTRLQAVKSAQSLKHVSNTTLLAQRRTRVAAACRMSRMLTRLTPRGTSSGAFVRSNVKLASGRRRSLRVRDVSISSDEDNDTATDQEDKPSKAGMLRKRKILSKKSTEKPTDVPMKRSTRKSLVMASSTKSEHSSSKSKSSSNVNSLRVMQSAIIERKRMQSRQQEAAIGKLEAEREGLKKDIALGTEKADNAAEKYDKERRKSEKKKTKQSLRELQDQLLEEAKRKIGATSMASTTPVKLPQQEAEKQSKNGTSLKEKTPSSHALPVAKPRTVPIVVPIKSEEISKPRKILPKPMASGAQSNPLRSSLDMETSEPQAADIARACIEPGVPVTQPLIINTALEGACASATTQANVVNLIPTMPCPATAPTLVHVPGNSMVSTLANSLPMSTLPNPPPSMIATHTPALSVPIELQHSAAPSVAANASDASNATPDTKQSAKALPVPPGAPESKPLLSPGPPALSPQAPQNMATAEAAIAAKSLSRSHTAKDASLPKQKMPNVVSVKEEKNPYDFEAESTESKPYLTFPRKSKPPMPATSSSSNSIPAPESIRDPDDEPLKISTSTTSMEPAESSASQVSPQAEMVDCSLECTGDTADGSFPIPKELVSQLTAQAKKEGKTGQSMTYFIPLQSSPGQSLGVAVKLATEGPPGPNQKVIMKAKLVTKPVPVEQKTICKKDEEPKSKQPAPRKFPRMPVASPSSDDESDISQTTSHWSAASPTPSTSRKGGRPKSKSLHGGEVSESCLGQVETMDKFPKLGQHAHLVEAPVYSPSEAEFKDPMKYIESIRKEAEPFGICKIIPPSSFKPECNVADDMRFTAYNQYVHKLMNRWGSNAREMTAIKKYLETQNVFIKTHPAVAGVEIDLPALYNAVQSFGGLTEVIQRKRWGKIADYLRIPKGSQDRGNKLDDIYCKYLLPWDTLSEVEREDLLRLADEEFDEMYKHLLEQCTSDEARKAAGEDEEDVYSEDEDIECVLKGKSMSLSQFFRVARNIIMMIFKKEEPEVREVEEEFWRIVLERDCHIQVQQGSIDTGNEGFGFPTTRSSSCGCHPWNLKILSNNIRSLLRCMGPVMGVTVPTLHVGMIFTTSCWYRDPHGLPWIEYLHTGASKVWYGVPDSHSIAFYTAMKQLVPGFCKKKKIWLPADTAAVPPNLLVKHGVSVSRIIQEPGQFLVVFPKSYTSSLCTGYSISESVYFALKDYLDLSTTEFQNIRESNEPMMFPLAKLLICIASDSQSSKETLQKVKVHLEKIRDDEYIKRTMISDLGVKHTERIILKTKKQDQDDEYECEICSENLYVSYVCDIKEDTYYCLDHAVKYLQRQKPSQRKHCKLLFTHSKEEISTLIKQLNKRLQSMEDDSSSSSEDEEVIISRRIYKEKKQPPPIKPAPAAIVPAAPKRKVIDPVESHPKSEPKRYKYEEKKCKENSYKPKPKPRAEEAPEPSTSSGRGLKSDTSRERRSNMRQAAHNRSGNLVVEILDMILSSSESESEEENEEDSDY